MAINPQNHLLLRSNLVIKNIKGLLILGVLFFLFFYGEGMPKQVRQDRLISLSLRGIATQFRGNLININGLPRKYSVFARNDNKKAL